MNMVIVLEILGGILLLAAAVRYAVRDTRQRRGVTEPEGTGDVPAAHGGERETEPHPSEVTDQREGEEAAALSASSTAPELPASPR
ncbi:MAG: hypothetical protein ACRDTA_23020 [Pseudonocardiaceae bacterium]